MARPKKVTRFRLTAFKNRSNATSWRVSGTKPDGSRVRKNFKIRSEAVQMLADLEMEAAGMPERRRALRTTLTSEQLADAEAAYEQLESRRLAPVISHYHALERRARGKGITLDAAISFAERHYRAEVKSISILNARDEFLRTRMDIKQTTLKNYTQSLGLLLKVNPNKPVHEFAVTDIEKILSKFPSISSRKSHRRIFSIFFNWCIRHHYCTEDPCKRLDKLPKESSKIAVLSLPEVKRLLTAALQYQNGVTAAPVAILLFAGLRPSELAELTNDDIGSARIRVTGGKLRRTLKRSVPIPPVLSKWLENYPFEGLPAGWHYKLKILKRATQAKEWVQDILRHTSITFQVERDKDEGLTAFNCGTSKEMMDRHYRNSIDDPAEVAEFWSLTPESIRANVQSLSLPTTEKIDWPSREELVQLVWTSPMTHVARKIGVSDVALKKHCVKAGIDLPPRGYWLRDRSEGQVTKH